MRKCPRCNEKGYIARVREGEEVKEYFCCSYCFYDEGKNTPKEKVIEFKINKEEDLLAVMKTMKKELENNQNKTELMRKMLNKIVEIEGETIG